MVLLGDVLVSCSLLCVTFSPSQYVLHYCLAVRTLQGADAVHKGVLRALYATLPSYTEAQYVCTGLHQPLVHSLLLVHSAAGGTG